MTHSIFQNHLAPKKMGMKLSALASVTMIALVGSGPAWADSNASIIEKNGQRCITSNGLPDHDTGQFPNSGNPHSIKAQNVNLCVTTSPQKGSRAQEVNGSVGVGLNGVQIRPETADYYDPSSPRGYSRDPSSGWRLDGMTPNNQLGLDQHNAHVDIRGLYHYHGISSGLNSGSQGTLIGYAADGFEIHYVGNSATSSYQLKSGTRPDGPGGKYDGSYVQDFEYVKGAGNLDECNGGLLNGTFVYFATDSFPYYPHCLWGNISGDFTHGG